MKKLFFAVAVIVLSAVLICCMPVAGTAKASGAKLTTPDGITLVQNGANYSITWTQVVDNVGYVIEIDGEETTTDININYTGANDLSMGVAHSVRVKALASDGNVDSDYSACVNIVKAGKLSAPAGIEVDNLVLSWSSVKNAVAYKVTVNGIIIAENTTAVSIDLSDKLYSTGEYLIKIKTLGDNVLFYDSDYSAEYSYTHTKVLAMPANLAVTESEGVVTASWDEVTYASTYEVDVDGTVYEASDCSLDITDYVEEVADHNVKVRAKATGNFTASEYSTAKIYSTHSEIDLPVITVENGVASWTRPEGANGFSVIVKNIDGEVYRNAECEDTSLDIAAIAADKAAGEYVIEVQALSNGNYNQSDISSASYIKYVKLDSPVLTITGQKISWTAVTNAVNYTVTVDGRVRNATLDALEYDFSADVSEAKTYVITVSANANGWYTVSDVASKEYVFEGKLAKTDVSADGLTLNWTVVVGAQTYAVTVDGVKVASGISALTFDLTEYCNESKTYNVGVYAEATGGYSAADPVTIDVTGVENTSSDTKTYNLNTGANSNFIYFVDGVKTTCTTGTIGTCQTVTLPSDAQKLIVVIDNDCFKTLDEDLINSNVYAEIDLTSAVLNNTTELYDVTIPVLNVSSFSSDTQPSTVEEGYDYIISGETKYYYHVKADGNIPAEIG